MCGIKHSNKMDAFGSRQLVLGVFFFIQNKSIHIVIDIFVSRKLI